MTLLDYELVKRIVADAFMRYHRNEHDEVILIEHDIAHGIFVSARSRSATAASLLARVAELESVNAELERECVRAAGRISVDYVDGLLRERDDANELARVQAEQIAALRGALGAYRSALRSGEPESARLKAHGEEALALAEGCAAPSEPSPEELGREGIDWIKR